MIKITLRSMLMVLVGVVINGASSMLLFADGLEKPSVAWKLCRGGKIYDNWTAMFQSSVPTKTHSHYPATGTKTGKSTWRCKECHGWDYKGREGAYSKGSHYTGIKGIRDMEGKSVDRIKSIIRNDIHGYTETMISDKELDYLALFVSRGQIDMSQYIDYSNKKIKGNVQRGESIYQTICAVCHGMDGRKISFHGWKKNPEYLGTVANNNPWEIFHKIRNGQPGAVMVSLRTLKIQDQLDLLAYIKLLPMK
ncbi:MAG: c-type cytochrome [Gammaproteobacteria bacterium]